MPRVKTGVVRRRRHKKILKQAKVAITPGIDFGKYNQFVRIAYTKNLDELQEAVNRIKEFIKNI